MSGVKEIEFVRLMLKCLEGTAEPHEQAALDACIQSDPAAARLYVEFLYINAEFSRPGTIGTYIFPPSPNDFDTDQAMDVLDARLWAALADEEKTADSISIPDEHADGKVLIDRVIREKTVHKINKTSLVTAVCSLAALLLMLLYVQFSTHNYMEVASIVDQMDAKWDSPFLMKNGTRMKNSRETIHLLTGIARLETDLGVELYLEAPAGFAFISPSEVQLNYGRMFSRVPYEGIGFTVSTFGSKIIDLGTEFALQVQVDGNTEMHVLKGQTKVVPSNAKRTWGDNVFSCGQAVFIPLEEQELTPIVLRENAFVQGLNSKHRIVWRGEPLNLADMIGGGGGLGTGQAETGINPMTGFWGEYVVNDRASENLYVKAPAIRYIDGVFVPDGSSRQVVTSLNHVFEECPVTSGIFFTDIINGIGVLLPEYPELDAPAELNGIVYGDDRYPSIFLHANLGITFDLQAIRADYPQFARALFSTTVGLSSAAPREAHAAVWVLVDGKVRYSRQDMTEKGVGYPIAIELDTQDRFLTLIATDGGDNDIPEPGHRATDSDWCVFVQPLLTADTAQ